jgi:hypothetical protein
MDFTEIDQYLHNLYYSDPYTSINLAEDRQKLVFTANEMLLNFYDQSLLDNKLIAKQALYMAEGEGEEFALFKRQGVKTMGLDGMNFTFELNNISPDVQAAVSRKLAEIAAAEAAEQAKNKRAGIGRLI